MASLRDAECAIRKLNDFQIEKYKIAVKVAKKDKGNAGSMQQKKVRTHLINLDDVFTTTIMYCWLGVNSSLC